MMECRATIKLSAPFEEYSMVCEYGSSTIEKSNEEPQSFLLTVPSPLFVDGASVVLIGKDGEDEALMLEVNDSDNSLRWTSFVLEEAVSFIVEFSATTPSEGQAFPAFSLCTKHGGMFIYLCMSPEGNIFLSATCPDVLSFEVVQVYQADSDIELNSESLTVSTAEESKNYPVEHGTFQERSTETQSQALAAEETPFLSHSPAPVLYSGSLLKKGDDLLGHWKKRYFVALNQEDDYRIDYYDREGGSKKGSIDLRGFHVVQQVEEGNKFGLLLVPAVTLPGSAGESTGGNDVTGATGGGSRQSWKSKGAGRIYRLRAESAEDQAEWVRVFSLACSGATEKALIETESPKELRGEEEGEGGGSSSCSSSNVSPSPPPLTAESLSSNMQDSPLSITIPTSLPPSPLTSYTFAEGPLGMTLKRRATGIIYIATVEADTQAARHGLVPGSLLWSIGSRVVGNTAVDKEGWGYLVDFIKHAARPIEVVFQSPSAVVTAPTEEEEDKLQQDCSSAKSAYSLLDYPGDTPQQQQQQQPQQQRVPSPSTPLSLVSVPSISSSSSLPVSDGDEACSGCSGTTSLSVPSVETFSTSVTIGTEGSSLVHVPSSQLSVYADGDGGGDGQEGDVERSIVEDLSKLLIFKNISADSHTHSSGKGWKGLLRGAAGGGKRNSKPSFELAQEGRRLVFEGQLLLLAKKALWHVRIPKMLFLFNDILIVAAPTPSSSGGPDKFTVEHIVDLVTCKVNCRVSPSHELVEGQCNAEKRLMLWELVFPGAQGGGMVFLCPSLEIQLKWVQHTAHTICEFVNSLNGSAVLGIGWRHQYLLGTMHSAVIQRDEELVMSLLESYAAGEVEEDALEGSDEEGYTPLHYACIMRLTGIVQLLQESSADVSAPDHRGLSPLHWAALQLDARSLERLCLNLMDVDLEDHKGRTPLFLACVEGRSASGSRDPSALLACVTTLLTYGADPDRKDKEGMAVLHFLSASWQYPVVELLLDGVASVMRAGGRSACADVNIVDESEGWTSLHYVCGVNSMLWSEGEGHMILQSVLPDLPFSLSGHSVGHTPDPTLAARGAGLRTLLTLLQHGALPNMTTFLGHTALSVLALSTLPRSGTAAEAAANSLQAAEEDVERWAGSYDSAIAMLLSHGARLCFAPVSPPGPVSYELPAHWHNPAAQSCVAEGAAAWTKKEQLDGDVAGLRLKCYEKRKCTNAIDTADLRQLAARMSESGVSSSGSGGGSLCLLCLTPFTLFRRQHHCRLCDALCCDECSRKRILVDTAAVRVCDTCYCLAKQRIDSVLTEQFFAGQGAKSSANNAKTELMQGSKPAAASSLSSTAGLDGTMSTMADAKLQLQERGEKLANLGDKSEKLANASNEFANMAKLLKEQNKSSSWW